MLFNSFQFVFIFFPVVFLGFYVFGRINQSLAILWLCGASLYFFGQWNAQYLWLLSASIITNYVFGYTISHSNKLLSKYILIAALCSNLLILGYYKYSGFLADTLHKATGMNLSFGQIILPLGISFFTFTQIAFLVDSYQRKAKEYNFSHYILFVTYFPHLIAGPILHHSQMMPQFRLNSTYRINWDNITRGLMMFIIGFGKKMLLADSFSGYVRPIFDLSDQGSTPLFFESWMAILAYGLQLYFDFSGYCDMAIGISLCFNIRLPVNFNSPYKSLSIIDFWRRWHITLSTFLRDYLYIPLGGNRHGENRRYLNVFITMLLGGLWHGAGWTFVIWGGLHGLYLAINHSYRDFAKLKGWNIEKLGFTGSLFSGLVTLLAVTFAWVFFRSPDLHTAGRLLYGMSGGNIFYSLHHPPHFQQYLFILLGLGIVWLLPNSQHWMGLQVSSDSDSTSSKNIVNLKWNTCKWWNWAVPGVVLAICILALTNGKPSEFLYFQF